MLPNCVAVTGAAGAIGRSTVESLLHAGFRVIALDRAFPRDMECETNEIDLLDAPASERALEGVDALVHLAAIADPRFRPTEALFANNVLSCYNTLQAAERRGVSRIVYVSSETVLGFQLAGSPQRAAPRYLPVDEDHPVLAEDAYGLSKLAGEVLVDAYARRNPGSICFSLRPSWVHHLSDYRAYWTSEYQRAYLQGSNLWSYTDAGDLVDAIQLALRSQIAGHSPLFIAAADNILGRPLEELVVERFGVTVQLRARTRTDASGIDSGRAREMLGYQATRSFRDYVPG